MGVALRSIFRLPEPTDTLVMNVAFILVFAGGATVLSLAILSRPVGLDLPVSAVVAVVAALSAAAVWPLRHRPLPGGAIHSLTAFGTLLITVVVAYGGEWAQNFTVFYLWMVVYAAAFFGPAAWLAHLGLTAVGYALAAVGHPEQAALIAFVPVVAGPAVVLGGFTLVVSSRRRDTARRLLECVAISGELVNDTPGDTDVLGVICAGTRGACDAAGVLLLVPAADDRWELAAAAGEHPVDIALLGDLASPEEGLSLVRVATARGGAGSRLLVGLHHSEMRVGMLVVEWDSVVARVSDVVACLVRAYAEQAAAALAYHSVHSTLTALARTDPLTGLANRRAFRSALEAAARHAQRTGELLSVVMFDFNRFKEFNDSHGHAAGDLLLTGVATGWCERLRGRDVLARLGGDEFALLLPDTDTDGAAALAAAMCDAMPSSPVTCSAGVATWDGHETLDALLDDTDKHLYLAKRDKASAPRVRQAGVVAGNRPMTAAF